MRTLLLSLLLLPSTLFAQSFVGTLITVKGDVKVLRAPGGRGGPLMTYEGQKYAYESAKIGMKVHPGEIVYSGPDGRAKLVYPNGDHFVVAPGTAMVVPSVSEKSGKGDSSLKLLYGKVRSLVSKQGPRKSMKVITPAAVAGVRGTDFFVRSNPMEGTQLTVLRGEVEVRSQKEPEKAVTVATGFTAEAPAQQTAPPTVVQTTKEELIEVQSESNVKPASAEIEKLPEPVREEITALQERTKTAVLDDIKAEDPKLYESLKDRKNIDVQQINTVVVAKLFEAAPKKKRKLTLEEIEAIGHDVYEQFFKSVDEK